MFSEIKSSLKESTHLKATPQGHRQGDQYFDFTLLPPSNLQQRLPINWNQVQDKGQGGP